MADGGDILSVKLEVKDSFSSQLTKFRNNLLSTSTAFNTFANTFEKNCSRVEKGFEGLSQKMSRVSQTVINQSNRMSNTVLQSTDKIEKKQETMINNLNTKYRSMGENTREVFKQIQRDVTSLNGVNSNLGKGFTGSQNSGHEGHGGGGMLGGNASYTFGSLLSGDFQMMLMHLGVIGGAVLGASKILTTMNGWLQQGFNALNTMSTGLFSLEGIQQGLETASEFETNRVAMNTLYKDDNTGLNYYHMGMEKARDTPYSQSEIGELQKKLAGTRVSYDPKDLMTLLDIASLKPELGADHIGFSLVDAMYGRTTSLKTNYQIDNKEVQKYLKSLAKSSNPEKRDDYKKWKNAFNSKGSVNNKQSYLDLILDYARNQMSVNGLTEKYAKTLSGKMDNLKGYWDTLKANLLGLDVNTGVAKSGVTVFSAIESAIDGFGKWLEDTNTQSMLEQVGAGLGVAVKSVTDAVNGLLQKVDWKQVGDIFKKVGEALGTFINKLVENPQFKKLIDNLPNLAGKVINDKAIDLKNDAQWYADASDPNTSWLDMGKHWLSGKFDKYNNLIGANDTDTILGSNATLGEKFSSIGEGAMARIISPFYGGDLSKAQNLIDHTTYLSDSNAETYLRKNPNITSGQRESIKSMLSGDSDRVYYDIKIDTIKANDFNEIVNSIKKHQANTK